MLRGNEIHANEQSVKKNVVYVSKESGSEPVRPIMIL